MKKTFLLVVSILLVSIMLTGCGKKKNTYTQDDIDRLVQQVNREIERKDEYKQDLDEANEEIATQLATITHLEAELAEKDSTIYSLNSDISNKDEKISLLEEEVSQKDELLSSLDSEASTIVSLQSEISKKDEEIKDLKQKLKDASPTVIIYSVDPGDSSSYLSQKFRFDGFNYSADTSWYSDISCKSEFEVSDVIIISPIVDKIEYIDGYNYYTVYSCMSNKGLVYTINYPSLLKIDY